MIVSTWLAPVVLTVEGRAASEQTWIMFFPCFRPDYRAARRAGEGHILVIASHAKRPRKDWIASALPLLAMTGFHIPATQYVRVITTNPRTTEGAGKAGCPSHPQPRM